MKTDIFTRSVIWIAAAIAIVISSCSSDKDRLLESVPFDAEFVGTVNLLELGKKSGFTIENDCVVLPSGLSDMKDAISTSDLKTAARWLAAIDAENIVAFGSIRHEEAFATAIIKDADELRALLKSGDYDRSTNDGFEIYDTPSGSPCFAISEDESQLWILPDSRLVKRLEDFEFARKKNNILRYSGLAEALTSDNILNMTVDLSAVGTAPDNDNYWSTVAFNVTDNAIVATTKVITPDGNAYHTDALQTVNTDFLRYMPSNFIFATAFGVNADSDWFKTVEAMIMNMGGREATGMLSEAAPYLKAIDGTVSFGFGPKSKAALLNPDTPESWQAVFMAHLPQKKVNELTELLRSNLPGSTETGNGQYTFTSRDFDVTYGMTDGYFGVGVGIDLKPDKQNSFTNDFNGKPFGLVFQTPVLSTIVDSPKLNFSIKTTMELNDDIARMQVNLVGTDRPVIPTLISAVPEFIRAYTRKVRDSY